MVLVIEDCIAHILPQSRDAGMLRLELQTRLHRSMPMPNRTSPLAFLRTAVPDAAPRPGRLCRHRVCQLSALAGAGDRRRAAGRALCRGLVVYLDIDHRCDPGRPFAGQLGRRRLGRPRRQRPQRRAGAGRRRHLLHPESGDARRAGRGDSATGHDPADRKLPVRVSAVLRARGPDRHRHAIADHIGAAARPARRARRRAHARPGGHRQHRRYLRRRLLAGADPRHAQHRAHHRLAAAGAGTAVSAGAEARRPDGRIRGGARLRHAHGVAPWTDHELRPRKRLLLYSRRRPDPARARSARPAV